MSLDIFSDNLELFFFVSQGFPKDTQFLYRHSSAIFLLFADAKRNFNMKFFMTGLFTRER